MVWDVNDPIKTNIEIPENAMPEQVLEIVAFIDGEGKRRWDFRCQGDVPVSSTLGLLEIVKHYMMMDLKVFDPEEDGGY